MSGALNEHVVKLTDQFDCEHSHFLFAGKVLHDDERAGFGLLSVTDIIAHSSNIGAAKIGIQFGQDRLYEYVRRFGFGRPTGVTLPGESWGIVHDLTNWTKDFRLARSDGAGHQRHQFANGDGHERGGESWRPHAADVGGTA